MGDGRKPKQEALPAVDGVAELAPGVFRVQLPIEMPGLGHVNTYLLVGPEGRATVVDPGLPGSDAWAHLVERLGWAGLGVADVDAVLVTHSHPDHFGGAGRLARDGGARVITHAAFRTWSADGVDDGPDELPDVDPDDLTPYDWSADRTPWGGEGFNRSTMRERAAADPDGWVPPTPTTRLRHGERIVLGGRSWQAVHTPGHTLDHLCLWDEEGGVLLAGDHVLPTITPHISGVSAGRDPLANFFASLDRVAALGGVRLALPAHGQPFTDVAGRCDEIKVHHLERIEKLRAASDALGWADVEGLSHELFHPRSWGTMAESETFAHLEHLRLAGLAERRERGGRLEYQVHGVVARDPLPTA